MLLAKVRSDPAARRGAALNPMRALWVGPGSKAATLPACLPPLLGRKPGTRFNKCSIIAIVEMELAQKRDRISPTASQIRDKLPATQMTF